MVVVHLSSTERDSFNAWMRGYWEAVSSGNTSVGGTMSIDVPVRRFSRRGIPQSKLTYGEVQYQADPDTGRGLFTTDLDFVGASDPLSLDNGVISFFTSSSDATAAYFYPAEKQVSGAESLDGTIFDTNPPENADAAPHQAYLDGRSSGAIATNVSYDNYRHLVGM
jgi:hypothetical protein